MAKIKSLSQKLIDGTFSNPIPIGADAENIDCADGNNLEVRLGKCVTKGWNYKSDIKTIREEDYGGRATMVWNDSLLFLNVGGTLEDNSVEETSPMAVFTLPEGYYAASTVTCISGVQRPKSLIWDSQGLKISKDSNTIYFWGIYGNVDYVNTMIIPIYQK